MFESMNFEQAMLHIACYDQYLKYKEGLVDEWYNLRESRNRSVGYHTYVRGLHSTNRRLWHNHSQHIDDLCSDTPFHGIIEHGSTEWFVNVGYALLCMHQGNGWFSHNWSVDDKMHRILDMIADDEFTDAVNEHINDGYAYVNICDECGEYCLDTTEINGDYICYTCRDNNYSYDNYHEYWFPNENAVNAIGPNGQDWIIDAEGNTSDFTWDDYHEHYVHRDYEDEDDSVIRGYHAHDDNFRLIESPWTKANKRHFGVELEVECVDGNRNTAAQNIYNWFENNRASSEQLLYEEDGSISHGFEMISNPMGLDKHREIWKWLEQKELINPLRSHNTSTCGLHVHVSKAGLSTLTISKAVCFVNNPSNQSLIKAIARRYGSGYCRAKHVTLAKGAERGDKYEMVNLNKRHTMEFRIFRGTLNYNAIQAAIEFTNAVINFSATTSMEELSELKFLEFIYKPEQRMDTKFLRTYLEQRSARIKDIVDRSVKPLYNLRVIKPEPVAIVADEPAKTPAPRNRGSSRGNVSYPIDVEPDNPNTTQQTRSTLGQMVRERLSQENSTPLHMNVLVDELLNLRQTPQVETTEDPFEEVRNLYNMSYDVAA